MKMEDHFKETLRGAVANEPPVLDAWDRFERRLGRSRRWRIVASIAGAVAVIVAAAVVVPQLGTSPTLLPKVVQPDPFAGWTTAEDPIGQWKVKHPPTWRVTQFEGVYEVLPPGEIATAAGEPTFAVTIARLSEDLEPSAAAEDPTVQRGTWPDGRPYLRIQMQAGDGSVGYIYRIDWSPPCAFATQGTVCDFEPSTLVVHIYSSDQTRYDRYVADADLVARSIEFWNTTPPAVPTS
ncbi:MAG: hypothetical protein ACRDJ1_08820 [Actinomycetota bacterium]